VRAHPPEAEAVPRAGSKSFDRRRPHRCPKQPPRPGCGWAWAHPSALFKGAAWDILQAARSRCGGWRRRHPDLRCTACKNEPARKQLNNNCSAREGNCSPPPDRRPVLPCSGSPAVPWRMRGFPQIHQMICYSKPLKYYAEKVRRQLLSPPRRPVAHFAHSRSANLAPS
jgi:hypothetical protein